MKRTTTASVAVSRAEGLERRVLMASSDLFFATAVGITPVPATAGGLVKVAYTVKNKGERGAEPSVTKVQIKSGDKVVAEKTFSETGLAAGASRAEVDEIALPAGLAAGTYRAVVTLDINKTAAQGTNTGNDSAGESFVVKVAATEVKKPNLVPGQVVVGAQSVVAGGSITVGWKMANTGAAPAGETVTAVRLGKSETEKPGADATLLSKLTGGIAPGVTIGQDGKVTIPASTPAGAYYLWVVADSTGKLTQSSTADDYARSIKITVTAPEVAKPNLVVSGVTVGTATVKAGGSIKVTWTVANTGKAVAAATVTTIRLGKSEVEFPAGNVIGTKETPSLAGGQVIKQDGTFTVPAGLAAGKYFVWVGGDSTGKLSQTSVADDRAHSTGVMVTATTTAVVKAGVSGSRELFGKKRVGLFEE